MEHTSEQPPEATGRWLRLLGRDQFERLMGACIESVLERRGGLVPGESRRLRWEVLRGFQGLLAARARRVRAVTKSECMAELERTHGALLRERLKNDGELVGLERELAQARSLVETSVLTPAEEETLARALAADLGNLLGSGDPSRELERVLARETERRRAAMAGVVARERERIDLLERRLAKLRASQEELERSMIELARRAELDGGLPSIYRTVQGLAPQEAEREQKAAMLTQIFEQNLVLQKKVLQPVPPPSEAKRTDIAPERLQSA